jgi:putative ABC transport system ATP-binding protein
VKPATSHQSPAAGVSRLPLIQAEDLDVGAGGAPESPAIQSIQWTISAGDYWVVGGPPGSGKSDLLATLAGLYRPAGGTVRLFGMDPDAADDQALLEARLRIGLVFESGGRLFHHLTVAENLALPLRYHTELPADETNDRIDRMLQATNLAECRNRTPGRLNAAWRQRVALARALMMRPEVLLIDNPLAAAGPQEWRWWREFLMKLSSEGLAGGRALTLVLTCHDLRPWTDQGRQFALLKQKKWLSIGGREQLAGCAEPLLRELLASDLARG